MDKFVDQELSGWGCFRSSRGHIYRPETVSAIAAVLQSRKETNYIGRGLGRSYGDAALNRDCGVVLTERINRFLSFEPDTGVLSCEAGVTLAAIIHKFGVSVYFLRKFRAESVFRCDYKASKLVEPNRDEARAPSGNSSARRGLYICVGAGSQGTVRWDTDGASVMRRAFVRDKTMPGAPRCDEKFPEPGHRF